MRISRIILGLSILCTMLSQSVIAQDFNNTLISGVLTGGSNYDQSVPEYLKLEAWKAKNIPSLKVRDGEQGAGEFKMMLEFNKQGYLSRLEEPTKERVLTFTYTEKGSLDRVKESSKGKLVNQFNYIYDKKGQLKESVLLSQERGVEVEWHYEGTPYPSREITFEKGRKSATVNFVNVFDTKGRLVSHSSDKGAEHFLYNAAAFLTACVSDQPNLQKQTVFTYENADLKTARRYLLDGMDYKLQATTEYVWDQGILTKESVKFRDPNKLPVVRTYSYDGGEVFASTRGGGSYGTPVNIEWVYPFNDSMVTSGAVDIKLELRPGPGQELPDFQRVLIRRNDQITDKEVGKVWLEHVGPGNLWMLEKRMELKPGSNNIRVEVETPLGFFTSTSRGLYYRDPNARIHLSNLYVLSIGVTEYDSNFASPANADMDAIDMAGAFKSQEGTLFGKVQVDMLLNESATREKIIEAMRKIRSQAGEQDLVVVYFSGAAAENAGRTLLMPSDAKGGSATSIEESGFDANWWTDQFFRLPAHGIFMFDALTKEKGTTELASFSPAFYDRFRTEDIFRFFIMSQHSKGETKEDAKWNNGAYTEALMEGLQGEADTNHDGVVALLELDNYLTERVKALSKESQTVMTLNKGIGMVPLVKTAP